MDYIVLLNTVPFLWILETEGFVTIKVYTLNCTYFAMILFMYVCCHFSIAADGRGRERQREPASTLEVPEQQRTPTHHIRSRSVSPHREEQGRIRSRPPNVPPQRWGLSKAGFYSLLLYFSHKLSWTHCPGPIAESCERALSIHVWRWLLKKTDIGLGRR